MLTNKKTNIRQYCEKILGILNQSSKGALVGSLVASLICIFYFAGIIRTGLPFAIDVIIIIAAALLLVSLIFAVAYLIDTIARRVNKYIVIAVIGTMLLTTLLPDETFNRPFIFIALVSGIVVGIAVHRRSSVKTRMALILLVLVVNTVLAVLLFSKGADHAVPVTSQYWDQNPLLSEKIGDPAGENLFQVGALFYGSGDDRQRTEYREKITLKTRAVDASAFLSPQSRWKSFLRKSYWGFGAERLPLNGRVWYPRQPGVFPLVILVHGNHLMTDYSDGGYAYLGESLARKGFIVASIDENFLNESWFDDFWYGEMNARAWLILKHLEYWRQWNATPGNLFQGKVDLSNICLVGHSRGADAVAIASALNPLGRFPFDGSEQFDFNFGLKSIVQIAPAGRQAWGAEVPLKLKQVNYLLLHGSHDQDVYYCAGVKMYNRIQLEPGSQQYLKAMLYIYKANHGQFNTAWGLKDKRFPGHYFVNSATLLEGSDQRNIAQRYISAFLQVTLRGKNKYLPLLKDCRNGFGFLPRNYYVNQYEDNTFQYFADFEEDQELTTASLPGCTIESNGLKSWSEKVLPLRNGEEFGQENAGVFLEWDRGAVSGKPYYAINIADTSLQKVPIDRAQGLFLFIGNNSERANQVNFSIQIQTKTCVVTRPFSDFYVMAPLLKTELVKWNYLSDLKRDMPVERVLQFVQLPFEAFKKMDSRFESSQIEQIKFIFDRQASGSIIVDRIGFN